MVDSAVLATVLLLASASALLLALMLYPATFLRWFQRKRYQYEVTFSLYMLTSTEKFIFNSVLFLLLSLLIIAASLYLPEHMTIIANRMFYYFNGNEDTIATHANKAGLPMGDSGITPFEPLGGGLAGNGRGFMEP